MERRGHGSGSASCARLPEEQTRIRRGHRLLPLSGVQSNRRNRGGARTARGLRGWQVKMARATGASGPGFRTVDRVRLARRVGKVTEEEARRLLAMMAQMFAP